MSSIAVDRVVGAIEPEQVDEKVMAREWRVLERLEKTAIGVRGAGGITTVRRREPPGCLLYGPYWQLPAAAYRLTFRCRSGKPRMPSQPVLGVEAIAMNRVQLAWRDFTAAELDNQTKLLEFSVPSALGLGAGDEARLEFRFFHMGNADLTITSVDLIEVKMEEISANPVTLWRMLGRLERTVIGERTGNGVYIRQSAWRGGFLDGGRPFLQLPEGDYRLTFSCEAGLPKMAAQPVLGVEVIARRRWQEHAGWTLNRRLGTSLAGGTQVTFRDFTATELRSGPGSVNFTVPPELSLEGGQDVVFGFGFIHLGNSDLTVSAVELRRATAEQAEPVRSPQWRLLGRLAKRRIGTHEALGVTVRQVERAGPLLHGCRPALQLPAGRYRLSFVCRSGLPHDPRKPVLGVEVAAKGRRALGVRRRSSFVLARSDFTAATLAAETASIEFEVPVELSPESSQQVTVKLRFLHLRNADLTISAVNLAEILVPKKPRPTAAPRPVSAKKKKTNILIIGNCQAQTVYEALLRSSEFNSRLDAKYHFVGLQQNLHELGRIELENSDALLVQDIKDWESYPLRPFVRDEMRVIKFPLLHFASLWPFDHYNGPGDKDAYQREWPNFTFLYQDGLLARLRREIPDREQRLLAYRSLSVDGLINFVRLHDFEKRRLAAMDRQFALRIGQFILDNFQKRKLFYTTNHPNGQIIAMLMQYLLTQLGIDPSRRPIAGLDHLSRLQVPVHPKVARALGVKWAHEKTKYMYGGEQITWEIYVRRYIDHYG